MLTALVLDAARGPRAPGDLPALQKIQAINLGPLEHIVVAVDLLTSSLWANTLLAAVIVAALVARRWFFALALAMLPVARFSNHMLSEVIGRARLAPHEVQRVVETSASSFPSGHTIGSVSFFGLLYLASGRIEHTFTRRLILLGGQRIAYRNAQLPLPSQRRGPGG